MKKYFFNIIEMIMLGTVAFMLMFLETPVKYIIPETVKLDISDIPALLGAFAIGPFYGAFISLIKNLLHALILGTTTSYMGELTGFLLGSVFSVTAGLIYHYDKTKKRAVLGAVLGSLLMGAASIPINLFIYYPVFENMPGGMNRIIAAYKAIWKGADELWKCMVYFNAPFIFVKGLLSTLLCVIIYKPLSPLLHSEK